MLDRVGDDRTVEAFAACRLDESVLHDDPTGVAQGERELLDEERVALGPLVDDRRDRLGNSRRAGSLACQGERVIGLEGPIASW